MLFLTHQPQLGRPRSHFTYNPSTTFHSLLHPTCLALFAYLATDGQWSLALVGAALASRVILPTGPLSAPRVEVVDRRVLGALCATVRAGKGMRGAGADCGGVHICTGFVGLDSIQRSLDNNPCPRASPLWRVPAIPADRRALALPPRNPRFLRTRIRLGLLRDSESRGIAAGDENGARLFRVY